MAGVEFDRGVFVPTNTSPERSIVRLLSPILFFLAISLVAFVGYKIYTETQKSEAVAAANPETQQLQQQLAEMQRRLEQLEKHRKPASTETSIAPNQKQAIAPSSGSPTKKMVYDVTSASALPARSKLAAPAVAVSPSSAPSRTDTNAIVNEVTANREAWQATTNRLSDVVGAVGAQQEEISSTREALNQLLTQTHRQAVSFELDRGNNRLPVGPVTLQFKSADPKTQHYSVCVFFEKRCTELKDRALNEVVVFVLSKDSAPLELVATRIQRDQIVGYLEVPSEKQ
jgi:hypothetical protein